MIGKTTRQTEIYFFHYFLLLQFIYVHIDIDKALLMDTFLFYIFFDCKMMEIW